MFHVIVYVSLDLFVLDIRNRTLNDLLEHVLALLLPVRRLRVRSLRVILIPIFLRHQGWGDVSSWEALDTLLDLGILGQVSRLQSLVGLNITLIKIDVTLFLVVRLGLLLWLLWSELDRFFGALF